MPTDEEQHQPREEIEARAETAPEPEEPTPRGNVHSEKDESQPGTLPPPLPV